MTNENHNDESELECITINCGKAFNSIHPADLSKFVPIEKMEEALKQPGAWYGPNIINLDYLGDYLTKSSQKKR